MDDNSLKGLRALVLDDEAVIALDLEEMLRDLGAGEVTVAYSLDNVGADIGIDGVGAFGFDIVILDIALGGRSTVGFAAALSARGVPVVFATGRHDAGALLAGLPDVPTIGKPFCDEALADAVRQALNRRRGDPAD